ncbi:MAG TPA: hypothetical protein VL096_04900, partial [Pirellulaceae bacterium]|nr:hypothetical protein [Pirellulaceae bacterium]
MQRLLHSLLGAFFFATLSTVTASAASPASDVTTTLAVQNQWLGSGSAADGWKKYLKHDELTAELAKGTAADREVVADVLKQYESNASGLNRRQFVAVKKALVAWQAELAAPTVAELPNVVAEAKKQLAAPDANSVPAAKAKLVAALATLDRYLTRGGPASRQGWHTYLQWDKLQAELAKEAGPDVKLLDEVAATYFQNQAGLEQSQFTNARQALKAYRAQVALASEKDWKVAGETRFDEIVKRLGAYQQSGSDEEAVAIGQLLGELH